MIGPQTSTHGAPVGFGPRRQARPGRVAGRVAARTAACALAALLSVPAATDPAPLDPGAADSASADPASADLAALLDRGDEAWQRRAAGHEGARARSEPIGEAIRAFSAALEAAPENLRARWLLLRALYFEGEYVIEDLDAKLAVFERGREIADRGRELLERRHALPADSLDLTPDVVARGVERDPDAARIYFWSAVHWGLWGRHRGKIAAARQGVANKIRHFAEIVIRLDEEMEEAGGHRILGRLHAEAPKLPFVTGWVNRDTAIAELRRALEIAPEGVLTHLYLAEALLEHRPGERAEALRLLEGLARRTPDPGYLVEQIQTLENAKALLADLRR